VANRGLARKDGAAPLAAAVRDSRCGQAHTWLLEHAAKSWAKDKAARKETRDALAACAGALSGTGLNDGSTSVVKSLQRAWRKALGSARGEFLDALLTALAETAGPPARAELLRWLKKQKSLDSERHMRLVAAVGKTGDPAGVAVLLFRVESTPGDLLEATLVALFNLPEATLRAQGRDILRATHAALEGEGKGKRRRTYDQTRYQAWWTAKIVDTPPQPLPAGAGTTGIHALWWRVIDAKPRGIKPPRASKRTRPQMLNNRPNLAPDEWNAWHRRHR
ncbi:MAG: hypothetical protein OER88_12465, partial [Planctomycetota bacterium]|nr:hypothetical protein [Planctomycetota bacterium]